jgi:hypothetical protein
MATLNGVGRTAIEPGDLSTFDEPPKYTLIQGPARLYRFGRPTGKWWFDSSLMDIMKADFYESVYGEGPWQKNEDATSFERSALAVSREWNKLARISILALNTGENIDCFVGPTSPQPEWRKKRGGPILTGGFTQYVIYEISIVPSRNFSETTTVGLWRKWS